MRVDQVAAMRYTPCMREKQLTYDISDNLCWIVTSHHLDQDGYAQFIRDGKTVKIHRYMYEQKHGKIPQGLMACHTCDNPSCVNPDHIFLGTCAQNLNDRNQKGRQAKGSRCGQSKITESDVLAIRSEFTPKTPVLVRLMARKYGIGKTMIYNIVQNKWWKHV